MNLFVQLWAYRDKRPLMNLRKKLLQYRYFSFDQTSGRGLGINDFKKFTYNKYHADNFYQYITSNIGRAVENLQKKHLPKIFRK